MSDIRPQFFIVREEGTITPLVALDELPSDLTVRGVPRNMNPAETRGMTSLGTMPSRGAFYIVESLNDRVGITEVTDDSFAITTFTGGDAGKGKNRVSEKKASPSKQEKIYCSYWIRRGECDFEQQGCRFKHVMPKDLETLQSIGLSDIPLWYREKHNVASLRSGSRPTFVKNWRKSNTPPKAIEYQGDAALALAPPAFNMHSNVSTEEVYRPRAHPDPFYAGDPLVMSRDDDNDQKAFTITTDSTPTTTTTSPEFGRVIEHERTGGTYINKYELPATPARSRHLFDSQRPNNDYSMSPVSPVSTLSLSITSSSSCSPKSSSGGSSWSASSQTVKSYTKADMDAVDDTLDKLNEVLATLDAEPERRNISELVPFSFAEDRNGNIIPEPVPVPVMNWRCPFYF